MAKIESLVSLDSSQSVPPKKVTEEAEVGLEESSVKSKGWCRCMLLALGIYPDNLNLRFVVHYNDYHTSV